MLDYIGQSAEVVKGWTDARLDQALEVVPHRGMPSSFVYPFTLVTYLKMQLTIISVILAMLSMQVYVLSAIFFWSFIHHRVVHHHLSSKPAHLPPQRRHAPA
jgi:hypothetical protein